MNRTAVENSSLFKSVGYDPASETLEVEFSRGAIYQYSGVTAQDWNEFCRAESKGKHFSEHIRGKFEHQQIQQEMEHGVNCPKIEHSGDLEAMYTHEANEDGPFELQGVRLCGRCHAMLT